MSDDNTMDSVMIDLETMATGPNAGVIQVGAIPFNSRTGLVKPDLFEVDVDLHSALLLGGEVDASTVQFWRDQGGLQPKRPPKAMRSALTELARWLGKYPDLKRVWAQGPSFDVAILEGYYRRAGVPIPAEKPEGPPADALGYGWHAFPAEDFEENRTCPTCEATGFQQSTLGPDRCTFCDGTEGGNPPEEDA